MKKRLQWILALVMVLTLTTCSFAMAGGELKDYAMKQFNYKMWASWEMIESDETTHYFYEDSSTNPMVGYVCVQIQSLDAEQMAAIDNANMTDDAILGMIVSGMGSNLSVEFDTSMGTFGELTGMLFSGKWTSMNADIVGFVCREGSDFFFIMYADNNNTIDGMMTELTEELLPEVTVAK